MVTNKNRRLSPSLWVCPFAALVLLVTFGNSGLLAQISGFGNTDGENVSFAVGVSPAAEQQPGVWNITLQIFAEEGWHVYRPEADEFTIPLELKFQFPEGVSQVGDWKFPEVEGDGGHLTDGQTVTGQVTATNADLIKQVRISVRFQACNQSVCLPPKTIELDFQKVKLPVPRTTAGDGAIPLKLDVLNRPVNNREIYMLVLDVAQKMIARDDIPTIDDLNKQLEKAGAASLRKIPASKLPEADRVYESLIRSSLILANVYDCGKCDQQHVSTAGGVVVGADGLVLTNYHVIEKSNPGTLGLVAVTHEGACHPVVEVLSASQADDVALIRLGGDTSRLHPSPIARQQPRPISAVSVLSHPHREYFVWTEGRVSRFVQDLRPNRPNTVWMEITASFGAGSSGSGVFNEAGELIGLVSTIVPLIRKDSVEDHENSAEKPPSVSTGHVELNLHRCVPLLPIQARFEL